MSTPHPRCCLVWQLPEPPPSREYPRGGPPLGSNFSSLSVDDFDGEASLPPRLADVPAPTRGVSRGHGGGTTHLPLMGQSPFPDPAPPTEPTAAELQVPLPPAKPASARGGPRSRPARPGSAAKSSSARGASPRHAKRGGLIDELDVDPASELSPRAATPRARPSTTASSARCLPSDRASKPSTPRGAAPLLRLDGSVLASFSSRPGTVQEGSSRT
jgi:hypothetical protein